MLKNDRLRLTDDAQVIGVPGDENAAAKKPGADKRGIGYAYTDGGTRLTIGLATCILIDRPSRRIFQNKGFNSSRAASRCIPISPA